MRGGKGAGWLVMGLLVLAWGCGSTSDPTPPGGDTPPDGGATSRVCEPAQFVECACTSGAMGRSLCDATGTGYGECACGTAGACHKSSLTVSGTVSTSQATLDFASGSVEASASHKLDVDVIEDGCISGLELTLRSTGGGCALTLKFDNSSGRFGGLVSASLVADSRCPGFPDPTEGTYTSEPGYAPWMYLGPQDVPQRMATSACVAQAALGFPDKPFRIYRESPTKAELVVNLKDLRLFGDISSNGNESLQCIDSSRCAPGMRNGGDGWCVPSERCSPGYHDSGNQCVPRGTCLDGYTLNADGECTAWRRTMSLPAPRRHHASAALRGHLYVVGGSVSGILSSEVLAAPIGAEGGLGLWQSARALPAPRAEHRLLVSGDALYLVGGRTDCPYASPACRPVDILRASVAEDGSLGEWTVAGALPSGLVDHGAAITHGHLYVLGGYDSSGTAKVLRAPLQSDGSLGAWSTTSLPAARYDHGVVAVKDFLYVLGGQHWLNGAYWMTTEVLRAPLSSDGGLGTWQQQTPLPGRCIDHTVEVHGGYVHALGGQCYLENQGTRTRNAWHAWLGTDGTVEEWVPNVPFEQGRYAHSSTVHEGRVYVLGGTNTEGEMLGDVQLAPFKSAGGGFGP